MTPQNEIQPSPVVVRQSPQTVLWIIALLLAVIATVLLVRPGSPMMVQPAFGDQPMVGARGIFAFTGQLDKSTYGLFMMDVDARSIWCYQYLPNTRKFKLVAARSFDYDRYLKNYNNESPDEDEVKAMLEDQRMIKERKERGGAGDIDEALGITVPGLPDATRDDVRK